MAAENATNRPGRSVSIVLPFLNEAETLEPLVTEIRNVMAKTERRFDIFLVNDGSTDAGAKIAADLARRWPELRMISFTRNFGKASALSAGFTHSRGDIVITMDADFQDDPSEIPRFLEQIDAGFDVVSGWKQKRNDPISKTLPSKVFNFMTSWNFGIKLHDINCGFKAYTRRAVKSLNLYGELHRFTPAILNERGYRITEIAVKHNPRKFGQSKYGGSRFIKGILDIVTVKLVAHYHVRPLHFFALIGIPILLFGLLALSYLSVLWLLHYRPIGDRPLMLIGLLSVIVGVQILGTGLLAELIQSRSMSEDKKYVIDEIAGLDDDDMPTP
ncbi:glycosyltransferase family 2 protein [Primorskyibacter aestuariivivens]|uniref:glycosyltransferase family 2 protein n=1 Tax=Primorskyibacter aestuariivivens TaxID=1888912 RepID=UPI0023002A7A|nr:glycosyltransferase family 2 protein [Primorskyibacter aestuariivivens]MDA7430547.1 glycosyltransferase family 2 protein [Primorskyibacter aestuariivivens]